MSGSNRCHNGFTVSVVQSTAGDLVPWHYLKMASGGIYGGLARWKAMNTTKNLKKQGGHLVPDDEDEIPKPRLHFFFGEFLGVLLGCGALQPIFYVPGPNRSSRGCLLADATNHLLQELDARGALSAAPVRRKLTQTADGSC